MNFSHFDERGYPTLPVQEGYGEWVKDYDACVQAEMDLRLLARLPTVAWAQVERAVDLACGTGRTGAWLRQQGVGRIDGVDLTPEMLELARARDIYDRLWVADVTDTRLEAGCYDLAIQVLADEHLPDVAPLYREVARITRPRACFVIVGYHPYFLMIGNPTHYHRPSGEAVTIRSYVHQLGDHVKAAHAAGWTLAEMDEGLVDEAWVAAKPKWERFRLLEGLL